MTPNITRHIPTNKGAKPYTRASLPFAGGTLSATRYDGQTAVRVTFCDQWGEVSYPMLTSANKAAWATLTAAV